MTPYSITSVLIQLLIDSGHVGALMSDPFPMYEGTLIDRPDNAVAVYETTSLSQGRTQSGEVLEYPGFQIIVRSLNYADAAAKAHSIATELDEVLRREVLVDDSFLFNVQVVHRDGEPIPLVEREGRDRTMFSINGNVTLTGQEVSIMLFEDGETMLFEDGETMIFN